MSEEKIEFKCCYCKNTFPGEAPYCIPEDFPHNKVHERKPLCEKCGGSPKPTLDTICRALDRELMIEQALKTNALTFRITLLDFSESERVTILRNLKFCLHCGQDLEGKGPCTCMRDE